MVSPELFRRYPFFSHLTDQQLRELSMLSEEVSYSNRETILQEGEPATDLFFLLEGGVDLYYTVEDAYHDEDRNQVFVGEINPGEPFGISAVIEPHKLTSTVRSNGSCRVIRISKEGLREMFADDPGFETLMLRRIAKAAIERLNSSRIQLAAAYA